MRVPRSARAHADPGAARAESGARTRGSDSGRWARRPDGRQFFASLRSLLWPATAKVLCSIFVSDSGIPAICSDLSSPSGTAHRASVEHDSWRTHTLAASWSVTLGVFVMLRRRRESPPGAGSRSARGGPPGGHAVQRHRLRAEDVGLRRLTWRRPVGSFPPAAPPRPRLGRYQRSRSPMGHRVPFPTPEHRSGQAPRLRSGQVA